MKEQPAEGVDKRATDEGTRQEKPRERDEETAHAPTDDHLGAVETDKPGQRGQGNANLPALDENGQPADWKKICEDVIGANTDGSEGG